MARQTSVRLNLDELTMIRRALGIAIEDGSLILSDENGHLDVEDEEMYDRIKRKLREAVSRVQS